MLHEVQVERAIPRCFEDDAMSTEMAGHLTVSHGR